MRYQAGTLSLFILSLAVGLPAQQAGSGPDFELEAARAAQSWLARNLWQGRPVTWLLDATVLSTQYQAGLRNDASHSGQLRGRPQSDSLLSLLGAELVLRSELDCSGATWTDCTRNGSPVNPLPSVLALSEPRQYGDTVTVLVANRPLKRVGESVVDARQDGGLLNAWFVRGAEGWALNCFASLRLPESAGAALPVQPCEVPPQRATTPPDGPGALFFRSGAAAVAAAYVRSLENPAQRPVYLFDPTVLRTWYDTMIHQEAEPLAPTRSRAETDNLLKVLGAGLVLPQEISCENPRLGLNCTRNGSGVEQRALTLALGEPVWAGDTVVVLVERRPLERVGSDLAVGGRSGWLWGVWFVRDGSQWPVTCLATVRTDAIYSWANVRDACRQWRSSGVGRPN